MLILFVRHGESLPRLRMNYMQSYSIGLSPKGIQQATALGKYVRRKYDTQIILSSPIARAIETARQLSVILQTPISADERLIEFAPSRTKIGGEFKELKRKSFLNRDERVDDSESCNEAAARLTSAVIDMYRSQYSCVVLVTHALILQAFFSNIENSRTMRSFDEASCTAVQYDGKHFTILRYNTVFYLRGGILKTIRRFFRKGTCNDYKA